MDRFDARKKAVIVNMPGKPVGQQEDEFKGQQAEQPWFYIPKHAVLIADIPIFLFGKRFDM